MLEIRDGNKIIVPKGIRYISDWKDYNLSDFNFPHILDKKIPGCGFTEYCLTSNIPIILCSPRKILLENKEAQHPDTVLYFKNTLESDIEVDKDINKDSKAANNSAAEEDNTTQAIRDEALRNMELDVENYIRYCYSVKVPAKILVTYDSFRLVKEFLTRLGVFNEFYVVVDEMQSVFCDASFKSDTELGFVDQLQGLQNVCYVSATPMIDKYLQKIDEFKDLPYYELDWASDDPLRVITPDLKARVTQSIVGSAVKIINSYKIGKYAVLDTVGADGKIYSVESREAVFYVNSVKNILDIINKCELTPEECNILCANTPSNQAKIKKRLGKRFEIGKVPLRGEEHKTFTFCTRTVYLGADFYSTNARTFIFSDANIKTLVVDITLDLPQILGRQRLIENPWKNRAELYYKTLKSSSKMTKEEFDEVIRAKEKETSDLLTAWKDARDEVRASVAKKYQKDAKNSNYKDDYVAVNTHGGKDLIPVENKLVSVAEQRAFDIQQYDYKDRFSVFNTILESQLGDGSSEENINPFLQEFYSLVGFEPKMRKLCESTLTDIEKSYILEKLPIEFKNYYETLGPDRCRANGYKKSDIEKELSILRFDVTKVQEKVYEIFSVGSKLTRSEIKSTLGNIYYSLGFEKTPNALDLEDYFELKSCQITNKETGKRDHGFEIIKKK